MNLGRPWMLTRNIKIQEWSLDFYEGTVEIRCMPWLVSTGHRALYSRGRIKDLDVESDRSIDAKSSKV